MQPLVLSPKVWMWKPRSALASWPEMSHEMVVSECSSACSKVTVPVTLESPRRTATIDRKANVSWMSHCQRVPNKAGIEHMKIVIGFRH